MRLGIAIIITTMLIFGSFQAFGFNAKEPSPKDAKRLINLVKTRKTIDGSTVIEVLHYAEKMRPKEFKLAGQFDFEYDSQGKLQGVGVCYWIGAKRSKEDKYCDLSWNISEDLKSIVPDVGSLTGEAAAGTTVMQVEAGRDAFLMNIDSFYENTCVDPDTHKKYC